MAGDILVTFDANLGGNALVKLDQIKAQLEALAGKTHTINVNVNSKNAINTLNNLMSGKNGGLAAGLSSGITKSLSAGLKTQESKLRGMISSMQKSYGKMLSSPLIDASKNQKLLKEYSTRMANLQRALNVVKGGRAIGPETMQGYEKGVLAYSNSVKSAYAQEEAAAKKAAAAEKAAAAQVAAAEKAKAAAIKASAQASKTAEKNYNRIWGSAEQSRQNDINSRVRKALNDISAYEKKYQKLASSAFGKNNAVSSFGQQIASVKQMAEAAGKIKLYDPHGTAKLNQLASAVTGLGSSYAKVKTQADAFAASQRAALSESKAFTRQAGSMQKRIDSFMSKNPRLAGTTFEQQLQSMMGSMQSKSQAGTGTLNNLKQYEQQFNNIKKAATEAGKVGPTFGQTIVGAVKQFGGWMLVTHSIMKVIQTIKNMISTVRNLDTAMTELRRVTHETQGTYDKFYEGATKRAVDIGATLTDTIKASADFVKLGYSIEEAPGLADAALVYKNVGIGIENISDASASVISAMKAFDLGADEAMSVVDKYNLVGNNFAISSAGIGEAIERSASAMASAGNTLDETIALITAGNEVVNICATCA